MAPLQEHMDWPRGSALEDSLEASLDIAAAMQEKALNEARSNCNETDISGEWGLEDLFCPRVWDGILCWEPALPDTLVHRPCPGYVFGFDASEQASKLCTANGSWFISPDHGQPWTNYSRCFRETGIQIEDISILEPHLKTIKLISKVGYSVSFIALVAAFSVLVSIKRLRCPRNSLHMHLFMSFIFRALAFLVKDALFIGGVGLKSNVDFNKENADCKAFTSTWHYMLMANYCWILMEGLYLHNLIFLAFSDSTGICKYVVLGWGLPVLFIVPWIAARVAVEDTLCWTTNTKQELFWIIRGPITLSIIINFVLFLNITRVLFAKLFASQTPQARKYRYRKWFRSTLVLVPLFGAHYTLLLCMSLAAASDQVELVWLFIDQLFSSFQGFVVALLYCFMNGEVQSELRKLLYRMRCASSAQGQHQHRHSFFTQSVTFLSRGRSSNHSFRSEKHDDGSRTPSPDSSRRPGRQIANPVQEPRSPLATAGLHKDDSTQHLANSRRQNGCPEVAQLSMSSSRQGRGALDSSEEHLLEHAHQRESEL